MACGIVTSAVMCSSSAHGDMLAPDSAATDTFLCRLALASKAFARFKARGAEHAIYLHTYQGTLIVI